MPTRQELIDQRLAGGTSDRQQAVDQRLAQIADATPPPKQTGLGFRDVIGPTLLNVIRTRNARTNFADRSIVGEAGARFARGTTQTQFTMPGNLLTMAGDITGIDALRDTGTFLRLAGATGAQRLPVSDPEGGKVRKFVGAVAEGTPQFATQVVGSMIAGMPAFIALGVGPAVGNQYIETKERRLAEGATETLRQFCTCVFTSARRQLESFLHVVDSYRERRPGGVFGRCDAPRNAIDRGASSGSSGWAAAEAGAGNAPEELDAVGEGRQNRPQAG